MTLFKEFEASTYNINSFLNNEPIDGICNAKLDSKNAIVIIFFFKLLPIMGIPKVNLHDR